MEQVNKEQVWREVLEYVKVSVSAATFSTWISRTHLANLEQKEQNRFFAEIGCQSIFIRDTIEQRYFGLIQEALAKALSGQCDLTFTIKYPQTQPSTSTQTVQGDATAFVRSSGVGV